jgi:hypothetical protein
VEFGSRLVLDPSYTEFWKTELVRVETERKKRDAEKKKEQEGRERGREDKKSEEGKSEKKGEREIQTNEK